MRPLLAAILISSLSLLSAESNAQEKEKRSFKEFMRDTTHSPKKAALFSAVLPGTGQMYNRSWWKVPIVYGAIGTSLFFIIDNNNNYNRFRNEYLNRIDGNTAALDPELNAYSNSNLVTIQDTYRRWRDMSYIALGFSYILQIVDANVDAHFQTFDVSDDLSLRIIPVRTDFAGYTAGIHLSLKL